VLGQKIRKADLAVGDFGDEAHEVALDAQERARLHGDRAPFSR
jgi:hypothetical protein